MMIAVFAVLGVLFICSIFLKYKKSNAQPARLKIIDCIHLLDKNKLYAIDHCGTEFLLLTGRTNTQLIQVQRPVNGAAEIINDFDFLKCSAKDELIQ